VNPARHRQGRGSWAADVAPISHKRIRTRERAPREPTGALPYKPRERPSVENDDLPGYLTLAHRIEALVHLVELDS
jgi:hypothetical protein